MAARATGYYARWRLPGDPAWQVEWHATRAAAEAELRRREAAGYETSLRSTY